MMVAPAATTPPMVKVVRPTTLPPVGARMMDPATCSRIASSLGWISSRRC